MRYLISILMIVFIFSCEKNPIIEENYYSDITPFEMAGVVYWGVGATDNSAPLYTIYINGVVTQREPGEYTNVLFHGRLKSGITGEEFSADSAKLYDLTEQLVVFNEVGKSGYALFSLYEVTSLDDVPANTYWAMWVTYETRKGAERTAVLKSFEIKEF